MLGLFYCNKKIAIDDNKENNLCKQRIDDQQNEIKKLSDLADSLIEKAAIFKKADTAEEALFRRASDLVERSRVFYK